MNSDHQANAAKCQELAQQAVDPAARQRWMSMAEFWMRKGRPETESSSEEEPDLVKL